ncbi:MAG: MotA/TolQ/ExbB proton channel family protein [Pirellulaceae bacterium]|nr:MotA/TolQ/ExbB proton channel family protein [Pirellulaceae bacterium]
MFNKPRNQSTPAFQVPFWTSFSIGSAIGTAFYAAIFAGILDFTGLRRYAACHWVAGISVYMFLIAIVSVLHKFWTAKHQAKRTAASRKAIRELVQSAPQERPIASAEWLHTMWKGQAASITDSWLGKRITEVIARQTARGNCRFLEEDLRDLADKDADAQHESYGLVRIVSWAMPMFGFLGTVIGISETLGQMDTKALASGSDLAMKSLTAGLYVAFDTTAVGLVLTMLAMFAMYGVGRVETRLLGIIDNEVSDNLQGLLSEDESKPQDIYKVEQTVRLVTDQFLVAVERIVEKQTSLWRDSILDAQSQWSTLVASAKDTARDSLVEGLNLSLGKHSASIEVAQKEGIAQIDARYHQWQSTLSEQARSMHQQQSQLIRQTELLTELIDKNDSLQAIEEGLQQNLARMTNVDRFHEVAICLIEAVAVLGTQMERAGHLQVPKIRRANVPPPSNENLRRAA